MKFYKLIKALIFCLGLVFVISCEDDFYKEAPNFQNIITLKGDKNTFKKLVSKSQQKKILKPFKNNIKSKSTALYNQEYDIYIDTSTVQKISSDYFESYTFKVSRSNAIAQDSIENYVVSYFADSTYYSFIIKYGVSINDPNLSYNADLSSIEIVDGDNLVDTKTSCMPEFIEVVDYVTTCVDFDCASGQHSGAEQSSACDYEEPNGPSTQCISEWVVVDCMGGYKPPDGTQTDPPTPPIGGGSSTNNDNEDTEENNTPLVPLDDTLGTIKECDKIFDFLSDEENEDFKDKLLELANPDNFNENLDIEFEKSIAKYKNNSTLDEREGDDNQASVEIDKNPQNNYVALAHTHPNDTEGTYSIFSLADLEAIALIDKENNIDINNFVSFLITKKGNEVKHYAFTIHSKSKFRDFFYYLINEKDFDINTASSDEKDKYRESAKNYFDLTKIYFTGDDPLIKSSETNSELILQRFSLFMSRGDLGITLFETNENFDTFTKVNFDNSQSDNLKRTNCNN
ncbi:hypothetical protein [Psychroflexus sp. MBR-150]|jgi:hypothetical protein